MTSPSRLRCLYLALLRDENKRRHQDWPLVSHTVLVRFTLGVNLVNLVPKETLEHLADLVLTQLHQYRQVPAKTERSVTSVTSVMNVFDS